MAYVETTRSRTTSPSAVRPRASRRGSTWYPAVESDINARMHYAQQMLLAAIRAAGTIVTVAGVMLLRIF